MWVLTLVFWNCGQIVNFIYMIDWIVVYQVEEVTRMEEENKMIREEIASMERRWVEVVVNDDDCDLITCVIP